MKHEIKDWGITIVRVELKEIEPPTDVQETEYGHKVRKLQTVCN